MAVRVLKSACGKAIRSPGLSRAEPKNTIVSRANDARGLHPYPRRDRYENSAEARRPSIVLDPPLPPDDFRQVDELAGDIGE